MQQEEGPSTLSKLGYPGQSKIVLGSPVSGLQKDHNRTGPRPEKGPDRSPVFWFLRFKDRKKTGLDEPVASVRTGLL